MKLHTRIETTLVAALVSVALIVLSWQVVLRFPGVVDVVLPPTPTATATPAPTATATPSPQPVYPPGWFGPPKEVTQGPLCAEYRDGTWTIYFCEDCPEGVRITDYGDRRAVERALEER